MADAYTPLLGLTLPEVGASRDSWGSKSNANWSLVDSFIGHGSPVGMVIDFAGPTPPSGWLVCDGRRISRTTYAALFAVIGTYWGAGDGSTTFALPNLNGRATIGPGTVVDQGNFTATFTFGSLLGWNIQYITQ